MTTILESGLEVIGTARKPNNSDLRQRGLVGLPDPSPKVAFRRAELELEQAKLKAEVRRGPDGGEDEDVVGESDREAVSGTESSDSALDIGQDCSKVEEKSVNPKGHVDVPNVSEPPVVEAQKSVRSFRDRGPIQVHPYALEREMYHQFLKAEKVKAQGHRR